MAQKKIREYVIQRVACGTCWNICESKVKFADGRPDEPLTCSVCNAGTGQPKKSKHEIWEAGGTYRGMTSNIPPDTGKPPPPQPGVDFLPAEPVTRIIEVPDPVPDDSP